MTVPQTGRGEEGQALPSGSSPAMPSSPEFRAHGRASRELSVPSALEGSEKEPEGGKGHYYVGLGFVCRFKQTWLVWRQAQQTKRCVTWPALQGWGWRGGRGHCAQGQDRWPCEPDLCKLPPSTLQQRPFGWRSRVPVRAGVAHSEARLLGLQTAAFSPCPPVVCVCVLICFSWEDASHPGLRPAHVNSVYLRCLFEGHTSKCSHCLRCWGKDISL